MFGDLRPQDVSSFWKHIRTLDPWRDHPVLHDPKQDLSTLVGIQLHGDGAEMFRDDEVFVFSWSSVFASSGRETDVTLYRFPVLFVHERHMQKPKVKEHVNKTIAELVAWSLAHAGSGVAPTRGFYGEKFLPNTWRFEMAGKTMAGGVRAIYFCWKSDLKARHEVHKFERWYQCTKMCDLCFAERPTKKSDGNMNFKNMGPDPPYQFAVMDNTTYMRTQQVSDWSCVPGWTLHSCVFDIMHNLYLGTGRDVVASCLRVLVERGAFDLFGLGRGSAEMFPQITQEIHSTFKEH
ncbi:Uncharacterized protein SCF082_LOCUS341, partial [Durusdinium trenchii]